MVESFPRQRAKQLAAIEMFHPLEAQLAGKLPFPGRYDLAIAPGDVLGLKRRTDEIRGWVVDWVTSIAPTLVIHRPGQPLEHFKSATVPGTNLQATLYRRPGERAGLCLVFDAPEDREVLREAVVANAFTDKCGKLAAAKAAAGAEASLLLLEIADLALGNVFDLDKLVIDQRGSDSIPLPDSIWIVDTTDHPASLMISRDDTRRLTDHADRFLPRVLEWQEGSPTA
jgi:hypothetical protein